MQVFRLSFGIDTQARGNRITWGVMTPSFFQNGLSRRTLALGGARSGKSLWAETRCETAAAAEGRALIYVATGEALDAEMGARIAAHAARRGPEWRLVEAPLDLAGAIAREGAAPGGVILVDCLTLWLSNLIHAERDAAAETDRLIAALRAAPAEVVLVSNEIGLGVAPENALARRFRDLQGALNQRIAAEADDVAFVAAGLALMMKGAA